MLKKTLLYLADFDSFLLSFLDQSYFPKTKKKQKEGGIGENS